MWGGWGKKKFGKQGHTFTVDSIQLRLHVVPILSEYQASETTSQLQRLGLMLCFAEVLVYRLLQIKNMISLKERHSNLFQETHSFVTL